MLWDSHTLKKNIVDSSSMRFIVLFLTDRFVVTHIADLKISRWTFHLQVRVAECWLQQACIWEELKCGPGILSLVIWNTTSPRSWVCPCFLQIAGLAGVPNTGTHKLTMHFSEMVCAACVFSAWCCDRLCFLRGMNASAAFCRQASCGFILTLPGSNSFCAWGFNNKCCAQSIHSWCGFSNTMSFPVLLEWPTSVRWWASRDTPSPVTASSFVCCCNHCFSRKYLPTSWVLAVGSIMLPVSGEHSRAFAAVSNDWRLVFENGGLG